MKNLAKYIKQLKNKKEDLEKNFKYNEKEISTYKNMISELNFDISNLKEEQDQIIKELENLEIKIKKEERRRKWID